MRPGSREADLATLALEIRRHVVDRSHAAGIGHVGSALSIADIVAALYGAALHVPGPADPERDRFILSKGHAVLALYAALHATGRLDAATLEAYCVDGGAVGGHPEHALEGIEFSTGSLGHGLPIAAGVALASRWAGSQRRAVALLSDAECNEGSVWEAAMFAAHHRLGGRLVAIVDVNGQQALGRTADILDLEPLGERWGAFGWAVTELDGHDPDAIAAAVDGFDRADGPPRVILARTTFGRGVSFMESELTWHYWPLSREQHAAARAELEPAS